MDAVLGNTESGKTAKRLIKTKRTVLKWTVTRKAIFKPSGCEVLGRQGGSMASKIGRRQREKMGEDLMHSPSIHLTMIPSSYCNT